jgi:hypothetical protein
MKHLAITTYTDDNAILQEELWWLFKSWVHTRCFEVSDLICFHHPNAKNLPSGPGVIHVPLKPYHEIDEKWKEHKFINSVYYLTTPEAKDLVGSYEYCLRTDNDVFLTKNILTVKPRLPMFGVGYYVHNQTVAQKLIEVAQKLNIKHYFIHNIGSTILYTSKEVIAYSKEQFKISQHLLDNEFQEEGTWPNWYRGVLTMYAGELAAIKSFANGMYLGGLDCMSMSSDPISSNDYHIHAFHTTQFFSKIRYRAGEYNHMDHRILNTDLIQNYCFCLVKKTVEKICAEQLYPLEKA